MPLFPHVELSVYLTVSKSIHFYCTHYLFVCFNYLWLRWVFVVVYRLSLAVVSKGYSLAVEDGLLTEVASFIAEHRLWVCRLQ